MAGSPGELQIMYGVGGERRLTEIELDSLPSYQGSRPVRVGNQGSSGSTVTATEEIRVDEPRGDDAWR